MPKETLMAKTAQQNANHRMVHKAELSSPEVVISNQFKDNSCLVALPAGQEMQLVAAPTTADNYSGGQRLQMNLRRDCKLAGHGHCEGWNDDKSRPASICVEGKAIDLIQLCAEVTIHGGYEKVTNNSMWSSISERLGFGQNCGASVKCVYAKYLKNSDIDDKMLRNGLHENVDCWVAKSVGESSMGMIMVDCDVTGSGSSISPDSSTCHQENNCEMPSKRRRLSYFNASISHPDCRQPTSNSSDAFVGVVEWLKRLALNPGDPRKGQGPRGSKQNEAWVEECETVVMKARSVLWGRKELIYYGGLAGNMAKQKIPPAVYYKENPKPNTRTLEKLRANQTRAMKCGLHLASGDAIEVQRAWLYGTPGQMFGVGSGHCIESGLQLSSEYLKSMSEALSIGYLLNNNATRKRIPIGGHFQAQVPPWTGKALKEGKGPSHRDQVCTELFGGVCTWPCSDSDIACDIARVGEGRSLNCACVKPMSIECVRLHVAEERKRLKGEIGDAFYSWGFDDMGESVSARWTQTEERVFNMTVRSNPTSSEKNFWDELPAALPLKTVKELVSYYFNVFVVRRRAIENRIMPESIDSDDDERELLTNESYTMFGNNARVDFGKRVGLMPNLAFRHESTGTMSSTAARCMP